jgi:hypothetical protein
VRIKPRASPRAIPATDSEQCRLAIASIDVADDSRPGVATDSNGGIPSLDVPLVFQTHDQQLGRGAEALGLQVEGTGA